MKMKKRTRKKKKKKKRTGRRRCMSLGSRGAPEVQPQVELRIRHLLVSGTNANLPSPHIATMPPSWRGAKAFGLPELARSPCFTRWALAEPPDSMYFQLLPS